MLFDKFSTHLFDGFYNAVCNLVFNNGFGEGQCHFIAEAYDTHVCP